MTPETTAWVAASAAPAERLVRGLRTTSPRISRGSASGGSRHERLGRGGHPRRRSSAHRTGRCRGDDPTPCRPPGPGRRTFARPRSLHRPLRRGRLRRRRHPRPPRQRAGCLPGSLSRLRRRTASASSRPPRAPWSAIRCCWRRSPTVSTRRTGTHLPHRRPRFLSTRSVGRRAPPSPSCVKRSAISGGFSPVTLSHSGRRRADSEPQRHAPVGVPAGGWAPHDGARRGGGRRCLPYGGAPSGSDRRRTPPSGSGRPAGRPYLEGFPIVFVVTLGLGPDAALAARWVRSWVAPGQPSPCLPERLEPPVAWGCWLRTPGAARSRSDIRG